MYATGFPELIGGVIQAPRDSTCGARILDYFIVSRDLAPAVLAVHCVADGLFQPHVPVRLLLRASPRADRIRVLKAPRGFAAVLPYGPMTLQATQAAMSLAPVAAAKSTTELDVDQEYAKVIISLEQQLSMMAGHSEDDSRKHSGRIEGPKFTWRCPPKEHPQLHEATPASRAWTRTASWLQALNHLYRSGSCAPTLKQASGIMRLQKCIRQHNHILPGGHGENMFSRWQRHITIDMIESQVMVTALTDVAVCMSDKMMQKTQLASRASWVSWVNDGPASGLRRQHRMSRVAIGWVRSKCLAADHDHAQHGDFAGSDEDYEMIVRQLQWDRLIPEDSATPMSLQQSVDDQATTWSGHWGCQLDMPPCDWPSDLGPIPPRMSHRHQGCSSIFPHWARAWVGRASPEGSTTIGRRHAHGDSPAPLPLRNLWNLAEGCWRRDYLTSAEIV